MFDFNDDVQALQTRIATLAEWHPELNLPQVDTGSVLATAAEWLPMYIGKANTAQELKKIDMTAVIRGMLCYEQQNALDTLARGRTCIIIAHRLSTVQGADRVAVIDGARVCEQGTPAELIARDGKYAALCRAQHLI